MYKNYLSLVDEKNILLRSFISRVKIGNVLKVFFFKQLEGSKEFSIDFKVGICLGIFFKKSGSIKILLRNSYKYDTFEVLFDVMAPQILFILKSKIGGSSSKVAYSKLYFLRLKKRRLYR